MSSRILNYFESSLFRLEPTLTSVETDSVIDENETFDSVYTTPHQSDNYLYHLANHVNNNGINLIGTFNIPFASFNLNNILTSMMNQIQNEFMNHNQDEVMLPLTNDALNNLVEKKYSEIENNDKFPECSICREKFESDMIVKILPCNHWFHKECITEWLTKYHHKCPLCRQSCGDYQAKI